MNPVDVVGSITSIIQSYPKETKVSTKILRSRRSIRMIHPKWKRSFVFLHHNRFCDLKEPGTNPEEPIQPIQPSQPVGVLRTPTEGAEIEVGPDDIEVMIDSILDNVLSQFDANVEPLLELLVEEEKETGEVSEGYRNQAKIFKFS